MKSKHLMTKHASQYPSQISHILDSDEIKFLKDCQKIITVSPEYGWKDVLRLINDRYDLSKHLTRSGVYYDPKTSIEEFVNTVCVKLRVLNYIDAIDKLFLSNQRDFNSYMLLILKGSVRIMAKYGIGDYIDMFVKERKTVMEKLIKAGEMMGLSDDIRVILSKLKLFETERGVEVDMKYDDDFKYVIQKNCVLFKYRDYTKLWKLTLQKKRMSKLGIKREDIVDAIQNNKCELWFNRFNDPPEKGNITKPALFDKLIVKVNHERVVHYCCKQCFAYDLGKHLIPLYNYISKCYSENIKNGYKEVLSYLPELMLSNVNKKSEVLLLKNTNAVEINVMIKRNYFKAVLKKKDIKKTDNQKFRHDIVNAFRKANMSYVIKVSFIQKKFARNLNLEKNSFSEIEKFALFFGEVAILDKNLRNYDILFYIFYNANRRMYFFVRSEETPSKYPSLKYSITYDLQSKYNDISWTYNVSFNSFSKEKKKYLKIIEDYKQKRVNIMKSHIQVHLNEQCDKCGCEPIIGDLYKNYEMDCLFCSFCWNKRFINEGDKWQRVFKDSEGRSIVVEDIVDVLDNDMKI